MTRAFRVAVAAVVVSLLAPLAQAEPRILMVGDSWAWFMYRYQSLPEALADKGYGDVEVLGTYTTIPGSTVTQWAQPEWLAQITRALEANPSIDIVHLSLCGNDFLRNWTPEMPDAERDALFQRIVNELEVVIRHIVSVRPGLHVAVCGYDYINASRGGGTLQDLNKAGQILAAMKRALCERIDGAVYIQNYGVMQYYFGVDDIPAKSVPLPGSFPDYNPWPGGNVNYGLAKEAMTDDIHLSPKGYRYLAEFCIERVYAQWLGAPKRAANVEAR